MFASLGRRLLASKAFTKYLLFTNVVVGSCLDGLGDIVIQKQIEKAKKNDWNRSGRMAFMGFTLGVPYHYWYKMLDTVYPSRRMAHVLRKVTLDTAMGPLSITTFYIGMCKLEGKTWAEAHTELREKFLITFLLDLAVWPFSQFLNFYFLPPSLRLMCANVVYFAWAMVLSYLKHNNDIKLFKKCLQNEHININVLSEVKK